jgi:Na+/phosphate symporter
VDLSHYNTEEEIADVIAQCEEKINQVKFKLKEYESKIREQKMKKDF